MAHFDIQIQGNDIHAEFVNGTQTMLQNTSIVLDPIYLSYSNLGTLSTYNMTVGNISGITQYSILRNGRNSRFSAEGIGTCDITLTIYDDLGNFDTEVITITTI